LKTYNQTNFFNHTFCEFQQVDDFEFPENTNYKSKSESLYFYTNEGVYRKSNHWGRVANCRWKLMSNNKYKNQQIVIAFSKWIDFYSLNETEKLFYIDVDFEEKIVKLQPKKENATLHLFTYPEAQKRIKKIKHLFKEDTWAIYFDGSINHIRFEIISEFIHSDKSLQKIKLENQ
jgi:hypothetical protein